MNLKDKIKNEWNRTREVFKKGGGDYFSIFVLGGVLAFLIPYGVVECGYAPNYGIHDTLIYDAEDNPTGRIKRFGDECYIIKSGSLNRKLNLVQVDCGK